MSTLYKLYHHIPLGRLKRIVISLLRRKKAGAESALLREIFQRDFGIDVGYGSYGGCFNSENTPPHVKFGNYCSVAEGVKMFRANHPMDVFTSHPLFYNPVMGLVAGDTLHRPKLEIGHDVWIGANAIILPSVSFIGNGAVIGAGSVVTKNVAPYTVVAGNPAKMIRHRFNERQIKYLEELKWWRLRMNELALMREEIQTNLDKLS